MPTWSEPDGDGEPARILRRSETRVSPWVTVVGKVVAFAPGGPTAVYHCLAQQDYVAILARTPGGRIPIVGQYRPAVEMYTWELPAGLVDPGEEPAETCRRELAEETGLGAASVTYLGSFFADTGRLENRLHGYLVEATEPDPAFLAEPGLRVRYVDAPTLRRLIRQGEFRHQLHLGLLAVAAVHDADWWLREPGRP